MIGLGTIINTVAIIIGGLLGVFAGSLIKSRVQESLCLACGISTLFIGMAGALSGILTIGEDGTLTSGQSMLIVISLVLGTFIGEILNIEKLFSNFGEWLKIKTGNAKDHGFVDAFLTASFTVCIGAMAIVGSIQDGIYGDYSTLVTKGILDLIIIMVFTTSLGKGAIFSAIPVAVLQGLMTALASAIKPYMTDAALANISLVGSILIFCVGINLVWDRKIRVANMLPALVIAFIWALVA